MSNAAEQTHQSAPQVRSLRFCNARVWNLNDFKDPLDCEPSDINGRRRTDNLGLSNDYLATDNEVAGRIQLQHRTVARQRYNSFVFFGHFSKPTVKATSENTEHTEKMQSAAALLP